MNSLKLFEEKKVRTLWDTEQEKWFISVIDVIAVLIESANPRRYWSDLKIVEKMYSANFAQLLGLLLKFE